MLYDRPYMQAQPEFSSGRRWLLWIIGVTAACFLLQSVLQVWFGQPQLMNNLFSLSGNNLREGKFWVPLSYALIHGSLWHLIFNLLIIFFVGRLLEPLVSQQTMLQVFLMAVFAGGACWTALHFTTPHRELIGASAGALGLLIFYCAMEPNRPITLLLFFILPITIKPKWIAFIAIGLDLFGFFFVELATLMGRDAAGSTRVAFSAHLGGMLAGYLFYLYLLNRKPGSRGQSVTVEPPAWMKRKASVRAAGKFKLNLQNRSQIKREVDRILDKINDHGFGSLSEEEKKLLDKAKDLLR